MDWRFTRQRPRRASCCREIAKRVSVDERPERSEAAHGIVRGRQRRRIGDGHVDEREIAILGHVEPEDGFVPQPHVVEANCQNHHRHRRHEFGVGHDQVARCKDVSRRFDASSASNFLPT